MMLLDLIDSPITISIIKSCIASATFLDDFTRVVESILLLLILVSSNIIFCC